MSEVEKKSGEVTFIPFGESQEITLSLQVVDKFIQTKTRSGQSATMEDKVRFIMLCQARRLNPWVGDAYLLGYDSKDGPTFEIITAYQALTKRAEASDVHDGIEAGCIVETKDGELKHRDGAFIMSTDTLVGAWAKVYRKDRKVPYTVRIKRSAYDKGRSRWKTDPEGMLVKCARAAALRECFPSETSGLYLREEMEGDKAEKPVAIASAASMLEGDVKDREIVSEQEKVDKVKEAPKEAPIEGELEFIESVKMEIDGLGTAEEVDVYESNLSIDHFSTETQLELSGYLVDRKRQIEVTS